MQKTRKGSWVARLPLSAAVVACVLATSSNVLGQTAPPAGYYPGSLHPACIEPVSTLVRGAPLAARSREEANQLIAQSALAVQSGNSAAGIANALAGLQFYDAAARTDPSPKVRAAQIEQRGWVGLVLFTSGRLSDAAPFLACSGLSPGSRQYDQITAVVAIAAKNYAAVGGPQILAYSEIGATMENMDARRGLASRLENALPQIATQFGAASRQFAAAEALAGALRLYDPQLALPMLRRANRVLNDRDIALVLRLWDLRLADLSAVPLNTNVGASEETASLRVAKQIDDFDTVNSQKSLVLLGDGDAMRVSAHARNVLAVLEPLIARNRASLEALAATEPTANAALGAIERVRADSMAEARATPSGLFVSARQRELNRRLAPWLARIASGDPDASGFVAYALGEAASLASDNEADRTFAELSHILALTNDRSRFDEVETRLAALQAAAAASKGRNSSALRATVALGYVAFRAAQGRTLEARQILASSVESSAGRRNGRELDEIKRSLATELDDTAMSPEQQLQALAPQAALNCDEMREIDRRFDNVLSTAAELMPGPNLRVRLCAAEKALLESKVGQSVRGAAQSFEYMATLSERSPVYDGWRRAALRDAAAASFAAAGDPSNAARLARASFEERRAAGNDDLAGGRLTISDPRAYRARLLSLAALFASASAAERNEIASEAISVAERLPRTNADVAIRELAEGGAGSGGALGAAVRKWRAADDRFAAAEQAAIASIADKSAERTAALALKAASDERDAARTALRSAFPAAAAALLEGNPPSVAQVQAALRPGEAMLMVNLFPAMPGTLLLVRKDSVMLASTAMRRGEAVAHSEAIRASIDAAGTQPADFPVGHASALFRGLFGPVEAQLAGVSSLMIIPDPAIDDLPFSALVRGNPGNSAVGGDELRRVDWLARSYAISLTPSVSSFVALRRAPAVVAAGFLGIANPNVDGAGPGSRGLTAPIANGDALDLAALRTLPQLPETAKEAQALAGAFGGAAVLLEGAAAREPAVRSALSSRTARVVAFSTHGLFAGEVSGLSEPALVVSLPPLSDGALPAATDDGLLKASEIAGLRIDADLAILSACNSNAGSGQPGAESLSGLARGFYVAGVRNVLASYWTIDSDATVALMTAFARSQSAGRAAALRAAMLKLIDGADPRYAHPYYWAGFGLFGAG